MSYEDNVPQTYAESFTRNFQALMSNIHTCLPGIIESYEGNRKCSVKPQLNRKLADGTYLEMPVIEEVPLVFPGGVDFGMTWPMKKGDPVLLLFSERSIEEWFSNGEIASPIDSRRFALTDAIAIPGLFNNGTEFPESNNEDFQILYKDASLKIKEDGEISIANEKGSTIISADGTILFENENGTITNAADGTISATNGSADLQLLPAGTIELNGNSKTFVTHTELDTALQVFVTTLNTYFASITAGATAAISAAGLWLTPLPFPPVVLDITAAGTITLKTGG